MSSFGISVNEKVSGFCYHEGAHVFYTCHTLYALLKDQR